MPKCDGKYAGSGRVCLQGQLGKFGLTMLVVLGSLATPMAAGAGTGENVAGNERQPIRFVFAGAISSNDLRARYRALLSKLAEPLGREVALTEEPAGRAALSLQQGAQDVDVSRVADFDRTVPGAIQLQPALLSVKYHAVRRQADALPQGWSDLSTSKVAFMRDVRGIVSNLPVGVQRLPVTTRDACTRLVALGRADVCILHLASTSQVPNSAEGVALHSQVLGALPLYMWVAPGKEELARLLQGSLKQLADSGVLDAVMQDAR